MAVLYGNDAFSISVLSTKKWYSSFFKKDFRFPENLSPSQSIENSNFEIMLYFEAAIVAE